MLSRRHSLYFPDLKFIKTNRPSKGRSSRPLYRLDWDGFYTHMVNRWKSHFKGLPDFVVEGKYPLPEKHKLDSYQFLISQDKMDNIHRYTHMAAAEYSLLMNGETSMECISSAYVEAAFDEIVDCLYDAGTGRYVKEGRALLAFQMKYFIWRLHTDRGRTEVFSGLAKFKDKASVQEAQYLEELNEYERSGYDAVPTPIGTDSVGYFVDYEESGKLVPAGFKLDQSQDGNLQIYKEGDSALIGILFLSVIADRDHALPKITLRTSDENTMLWLNNYLTTIGHAVSADADTEVYEYQWRDFVSFDISNNSIQVMSTYCVSSLITINANGHKLKLVKKLEVKQDVENELPALIQIDTGISEHIMD